MIRLPFLRSTPPPAPEPTAPVSRDVLRQVRLIELRTRGLVTSIFSGEYQSVFRGQGMEFSEVREYEPGDDVRNIDWNVTARTGHPYVKKHIEERELTVLLVVDLSGSEQFGTRSRFKAELAAELAAVLALSAVRNNDRVGLVLFSDHVEHVVPPRKGRRHVLRLIRDVLAFRARGRGTDIAGALDYAARLLPHRGIIFLLSDFAGNAEVDAAGRARWEKTLRLVSRRHDVVGVSIADPAELELPDVGIVALEDPETGTHTLVDTGSAEVRKVFGLLLSRERTETRRLFRRLGVDEIEVRTDQPYVRPLLAFFRRRERRGAGRGAMVRSIIGAVLLAASAATAGRAHAQVQTAVVPESITVGDVFHAAVRLDLPPGATLAAPDSLVPGEDLENAGRREIRVDTAGGTHRVTVVYPLAAWRPGSYQLPAVTLRVLEDGTERTLTAALPGFSVRSVLPADTTGVQPREAKDVLGASRLWWPILLALLLALAAALAFWWWWRRRHRDEEVDLAPPVPPREAALAELEALRREGLIERGELKPFYERLTAVLRRYTATLDRSWSTDLTTSELAGRMRVGPDVGGAFELVRLLGEADLVKFARAAATKDRAATDLDAARAWIERSGAAPGPGPDAERRVA